MDGSAKAPPGPAGAQTTTAYQGRPNTGGAARLSVAVRPWSGLIAAAPDIAGLLQHRLRIAALVYGAAFTAFLIRNVLRAEAAPSSRWFIVFHAAVEIAIITVAVVLCARPRLPLAPLRHLELLLFASVAVFFAALHQQWFENEKVIQHALQTHGTEGRDLSVERLSGVSSACRWFVLIVIYGIFIPNTGRRCAVVVAAIAAVPLLMNLGLALSDPEARAILPSAWLDQGILLAMASSIAIFGSAKISSLQERAAAARRLGQYTLKERLGGGGMGEVYLAEHALLRRPCAIKLIRPEHAADQTARVRFEREVHATASLTNWHTVQIYDYGTTEDGRFYYAMEYLPGRTLEELVQQAGPMPAGRVVHVLRQVCAALREAHAAGLVHRDLKPSNILLGERGGVPDTVKVVDFGLVQGHHIGGESAKATREGSLVGTPAHMSPEQASGRALDGRSDIYSLGSVAYFLLTGRPPFVGSNPIDIIAACLRDAPTPPKGLNPSVPAELEAIVLRCLEKAPDRRFPDVAALDAQLSLCACASHWTTADAAAWWKEHQAPTRVAGASIS